jgi:CubicO group peptidase (beta-lactamase class C family)
MRFRVALACTVVCALLATSRLPAQNNAGALAWFEQYLEALRQRALIPGLSGAIVSDRQIAWEIGLGFQDLEASVRATPDTPYYVADLTQTLTATLVLQCVERGTMPLAERIGTFAPAFPDPDAGVRHVLTHTSQAPFGTRFRYDPSRS